MEDLVTKKDLAEKAKELEANGQLERAAELYLQILSKDNLEERAYDRLMIVYRKLKDYKKELLVIDRGIRAYQDFYDSKVSKSKKVIEISNKLAKSVGLIDKKGSSTFDPEPIENGKKGGWWLRKE